MKSCEEDDRMEHQHRKPRVLSSRGNDSEHFKVIGKGRRRGLEIKDAAAYIRAVSHLFQHEREKYNEFHQFMKDFKARSIDMVRLKARVEELFKGNQDFILGFNIFMPEGCVINPSPVPKEAQYIELPPYEDARNFLETLKTQFGDKDCNSYLDIINKYWRSGKNVTEVFQELRYLFEENEYLFKQYKKLIRPRHYTPSRENSSLQRRDQRSFVPNSLQMHGNKKQRTLAYHPECGPIVNSEESNQVVKTAEGLRIDAISPSYNCKSSLEGACNSITVFYQKVKEVLHHSDFQKFVNLICEYTREVISVYKLQCLVSNLLGESSPIMERFNEFVFDLEKSCFNSQKKMRKLRWITEICMQELDSSMV